MEQCIDSFQGMAFGVPLLLGRRYTLVNRAHQIAPRANVVQRVAQPARLTIPTQGPIRPAPAVARSAPAARPPPARAAALSQAVWTSEGRTLMVASCVLDGEGLSSGELGARGVRLLRGIKQAGGKMEGLRMMASGTTVGGRNASGRNAIRVDGPTCEKDRLIALAASLRFANLDLRIVYDSLPGFTLAAFNYRPALSYRSAQAGPTQEGPAQAIAPDDAKVFEAIAANGPAPFFVLRQVGEDFGYIFNFALKMDDEGTAETLRQSLLRRLPPGQVVAQTRKAIPSFSAPMISGDMSDGNVLPPTEISQIQRGLGNTAIRAQPPPPLPEDSSIHREAGLRRQLETLDRKRCEVQKELDDIQAQRVRDIDADTEALL